MGLNERAKRRLEDALARSAGAGHDVDRIVPVRATRTLSGYSAVCSCGWSSTPRSKKVAAAAAATWHAMEVCDVLDTRRRLDLVEWSDAPKRQVLRQGVEAARHAAAEASSPTLSDPS